MEGDYDGLLKVVGKENAVSNSGMVPGVKYGYLKARKTY